MNSTHPGASILLFALLLALSIAIRPSVSIISPFCSFHIERASVVKGRTIHTVSTNSLDGCIEQCLSFGASCTGANFLLDTRGRPLCLLVDAKSPAGSADSLSPHPSMVMYAARRWCSGDGGGGVGPSTVADYKNPPSVGAGVPCINGQSTWMFERLANMNLLMHYQFTHHLLSSQIGTSLEACLYHCLQSPACYSVLHSTGRSECRLLRISPHRVHSAGDYFGEDDEWDLYESNCERVQHSPQHCTYIRRHYIGLVHIFDVVLTGNISDWHECEQRCLDSIRLRSAASEGEFAPMGAICRSYTYSRQSNACYLSHQSQPSQMGANMAGDTDASLMGGELSDCQHFSLSCASNFLTLSSRSMKLFNGSVGVRKSKSSGDVVCEQAVQDTYAFRAEIPFNNEQECGIEMDEHQALPSYSALLMVKEGGGQRLGLVAQADKMIQVNCRMHQQVATRLRMLPPPLTSMAIAPSQKQFELEQGNFAIRRTISAGKADPPTVFPTSTMPSLPLAVSPSLPAYKLEVLDAAGRAADTVDMEDLGYLQISAFPPGPSYPSATPSPIDFTISELVAENLLDGRLVELIDSNGCVSNYGVVKSLERWEPNSIRVGIVFSGFGNHARVTYQAMIKPCSPLHSCVQECNRGLYATGQGAEGQDGAASGRGDTRRTIRAIVPLGEVRSGRHIELHSDTYEVHSLAALRIGAGHEELEGQVQKEGIPPGFQRCLFNANCLLTVLSFSVQLLLCLICLFMLYSQVVSRCRHRSPCPSGWARIEPGEVT